MLLHHNNVSNYYSRKILGAIIVLTAWTTLLRESLVTADDTRTVDGLEFHGGRKKLIRHGLNAKAIERKDEEESITLVTGDNDNHVQTNGNDKHETRQKKKKKNWASSLLERFQKQATPKDYPLLPDRFSVLTFEKQSDFAPVGDEAEEERQVQNAFWGRIYTQGFPAGMQYFRAHFGREPPPSEEMVKIQLARPVTMCRDVDGDGHDFQPFLNDTEVNITPDTVLLAFRGMCSFAEKARLAHEVGALGVVFVNNEEGNLHPSGPEAHDLNISASMITKNDGNLLMNALLDDINPNPSILNDSTCTIHDIENTKHSCNHDKNNVKDQENYAKTKYVKGRFVPMTCITDKSSTNPDLQSYCEAIRKFDRDFVSRLNYTGRIVTPDGSSFEYEQAEFGSRIVHGRSYVLTTADAAPDSASGVNAIAMDGMDDMCSTISGDESDGGVSAFRNKAILVKRGNCDFATKAEVLSRSGAELMILEANSTGDSNEDAKHDTGIFRMGVDSSYRGSQIRIPSIMISKTAGDKIRRDLSAHDDWSSVRDDYIISVFSSDSSFSNTI